MNKIVFFFFIIVALGCKEQNGPLPYLGVEKIVDGKKEKHTIRPFAYINQDSIMIDNAYLSDYIYIADFFFTSCPSICPRVTREMLRIYEAFEDEPRVKMVSFTLDPKRDTPTKLNTYASNLAVRSDKWYFLTGDKDATMELAGDYFVSAMEDEEAPGGINHSGTMVLIDKSGHIRSFSDGTDSESTPRLIKDIRTLLKEYE